MGASDFAYTADYSALVRRLQHLEHAGEARIAMEGAADVLGKASLAVANLPSGASAWLVDDAAVSATSALRDINAALVRLRAAVDAIATLGPDDPIPPGQVGDVRGACTGAWATALGVMAAADALPDFLAELRASADALASGARELGAAIAAPVAGALGGVLGQLWPYLAAAAVIFYFVYVRGAA